MDTGLIFPDRQLGDGGTEDTSDSVLLDWRPYFEMCVPGKSGILLLIATIVKRGEPSLRRGDYREELPKKNF